MTTPFSIQRDINGYNAGSLKFSDINYSTVLATNVEQTITLPDNPSAEFPNWEIVIGVSPGSNVFVSINATATSPGASFALNASKLNPAVRWAQPGDILHFITPDASGAYVDFALYTSKGA